MFYDLIHHDCAKIIGLMYGCRFHSTKGLKIGDDVWAVGRCLISPVNIGSRTLILPGAVLTRHTQPDSVWGGAPAQDLTSKFGPQFRPTATEERMTYLQRKLTEFAENSGVDLSNLVKIVQDPQSMRLTQGIQFSTSATERTRSRKLRLKIG